jgi:hypothetical protein
LFSSSGGGSARASLGALLLERERDRSTLSRVAAHRFCVRCAAREILFSRRDRRRADEVASVLADEIRDNASGAIDGIADTSEVITDIMDVMVAMRDAITPAMGSAIGLRHAAMGAHSSPTGSCRGA